MCVITISIRHAIANLHQEIAADAYLANIPSIAKTNLAFHAKDDIPEVRQAVYKMIRGLDFKAQFVVARKIERVFKGTFSGKEDRFYDRLVSQLFENALHRYQTNLIYIARRGSSSRQGPLEDAIRAGVARFEEKWGTQVNTRIVVQTQAPNGEPCLQVIDYMNWAVYRAFVRGEMRYYKFMEEQVSLIVDLYDMNRYPRNWYNRENPFDVQKISPL
ncbi:MAG: hypothetical protein WCF84_08935 [Anaerolineae bacterium]